MFNLWMNLLERKETWGRSVKNEELGPDVWELGCWLWHEEHGWLQHKHDDKVATWFVGLYSGKRP